MEDLYVREFYNLYFEKCFLLAESEDLYFIYAPKAIEKYIVCTYLDDMGTFLGQKYFKDKNDAYNFYLEKKKKMKKLREKDNFINYIFYK